MGKTILYYWLEGEFGNAEIKDTRGSIDINIQHAAETKFLQFQIGFYIIQFILHINDAVMELHDPAEKVSKICEHLRNFIISVCRGFHADAFNRIGKKMWIDLGLKRMKLSRAPLGFRDICFFNISIQCLAHGIEGTAKVTNLIFRSDRQCDRIVKIPGEYAVPSGMQLFMDRSFQRIFQGADVRGEVESWDEEYQRLLER